MPTNRKDTQTRKCVLLVSFSPLDRDPRILRQLRVLSPHFDVITIGYGPKPELAKEHIEISEKPKGDWWGRIIRLVQANLGLTGRAYENSEKYSDALRWVNENADRIGAVITNDVLALPIGLATGKPVHADVHEYALGQRNNLSTRILTAPYIRWAAGLLPKATSMSTVAPGIARRYKDEYGVDSTIVTNSPYFVPDVPSTATNRPVKLVHMGVAVEERSLDMPIKAVVAANRENAGSVALDYYVVPGVASYIEGLRKLAGDFAVTGVRLRQPVAFDEIHQTLRKYDAAVAYFPPKTVNLKHTLPNKFFEAVQARIGVITGPSSEMGPYLDEYGFGASTKDWSQEALNELVASLEPKEIDKWKESAAKVAKELSAEEQDLKWLDAIRKLLKEDGNV